MDAPTPVPGRKTGKAPAIRRLKTKFPEMSELAIARRVGCSPGNVHTVLSAYLGTATEDDLRAFQINRADVFDAITMRSLLSVTQDKLEKSPALALATIAGIAHDKSQVLRGQATGINVTVLMDAVEAIRARASQVIDAQPVSKPGE